MGCKHLSLILLLIHRRDSFLTWKTGAISLLLFSHQDPVQSHLTLFDPADCGMLGSIVLSPRVCSDSCPWSQRCPVTISSSASTFSFCLQSFPVSGSSPLSLCIRWTKYWSFSFSSSNEYSGLISFRIDIPLGSLLLLFNSTRLVDASCIQALC